MAALTASTVGSLLSDSVTRDGTLTTLEHEAGAIDQEVALAAAPVLYGLLAADVIEVGRDDFDRIALLVARLAAEAIGVPEMGGAILGEGRYAAVLHSEGSVLAQAMVKSPSELTRADARSFACSLALHPPTFARGVTKPLAAAGFEKTADWFVVFMRDEWLCK